MPEPGAQPGKKPSLGPAIPPAVLSSKAPVQPPHPRPLPPDRGELILDHRACVSCGYSLKGIPASSKCPECGHPVRRSVRANRYDEGIVTAPLGWLRSLATGAHVLAGSGLAFIVGYLVLAFSPPVPLAVLFLCGMLLASVGWSIGVWMCTSPRPVRTDSAVSPTQEWARLRLTARLSQLGWAVAIILGIMQGLMSPAGMLDKLMTGVIVLSVLAALGGHAALCLYLSRLADWASDSGLSNHFKSASYLVGAVILSNLLVVLARFVGFFAMVAVALMVLVFLGSIAHFAVALVKFASMARWAVINNADAAARDRRLRERAERAARAEQVESTDAGARKPTESPPPASVAPAYHPAWERARPSSKPVEEADVYDLAPEDSGVPNQVSPPVHRSSARGPGPAPTSPTPPEGPKRG